MSNKANPMSRELLNLTVGDMAEVALKLADRPEAEQCVSSTELAYAMLPLLVTACDRYLRNSKLWEHNGCDGVSGNVFSLVPEDQR